MVAWLFCPKCKKVVDQFETKCYYCHSNSGPKRLNELMIAEYKQIVADKGKKSVKEIIGR